MSLYTDRPAKFLFGCLIVVLCWIIGAGQLLNGRNDKSSDRAAKQTEIQQTAASPTDSSSLALPFQWAIHQGPLAFYCFLSSVVVWVVSAVGRQIVTVSTDTNGNALDCELQPRDSAVWSIFDFIVSLIILASASVILARGLGWLFALLINVTAIVCYFLAHGPQRLADYCRACVNWLDQHYSVGMVNGDLPLGVVSSAYASRIVLPVSWWQTIRERHGAVRAAPVGLILFGLGVMITFGIMTVFDKPTDMAAHVARSDRPPTLLAIPNGQIRAASREVRIKPIELEPIADRDVEVGERLVITAKLSNAGAIDADIQFMLTPATLPGIRFYPESGVLVWTPAEPGTYRFTLRAQLDGHGRPSDETSFSIVVRPSRRNIELAEIPDQIACEGELLVLPLRLKNRAQVRGAVSFRLAAGAPDGAMIDSETGVGLFSWRPTTAGTFDITIVAVSDSPVTAHDEKTFRVVVISAPRPPVIAGIDDRTVHEGEPMVVPIKLKSPGQPQSALRFSLCDEAPEGAAIDPESGVFCWIPNQPGMYTIAVRCESLAASRMSDQTSFTVVVREVSEAPELAEIGNKIVRAGDSLIIPVKITNRGRPAGQLAFTMALDSPAGAQIDSRTGVIRWNLEADTPSGDYPFTVRVRNPARPGLTDQISFHVTVLDDEQAEQPVEAEAKLRALEFLPINEHIIDAGGLLRFAVRLKSDGDEIGELEYSLAAGAPPGASINSRSGLFTWRPDAEQASRQFWIGVQVRDVENPTRHCECRFSVLVNSAEDPNTTDKRTPHGHRADPFQSPDGVEQENDTQPPRIIDATPAQQPPVEEMESSEGATILPIPLAEPEANRSVATSDEIVPNDNPEGSFINSIGMHLVAVPDGVFFMGSHESAEEMTPLDEAEATRFRDEQPQHPVRISRPFFMGKFEVTVGQFRHFIEQTGYQTDAERDGAGAFAFNPNSREFEWGKRFGWQNTGWSQTTDYPVVNVSWNDAVAFCRWLSQTEGYTYRLPTEAEWEYACRAGTETRYSSGETLEELALAANLGDESFRQIIRPGYSDVVLIAGQEGPAFTTPVGRFEPNAFGLYDMHGNVFEWCSDRYGAEYYQESPLVDPTGPVAGTKQVIRGGSFFNAPFYSRCSFRNGFAPNARVPYLGFRVVMEANSEPQPDENTSVVRELQLEHD